MIKNCRRLLEMWASNIGRAPDEFPKTCLRYKVWRRLDASCSCRLSSGRSAPAGEKVQAKSTLLIEQLQRDGGPMVRPRIYPRSTRVQEPMVPRQGNHGLLGGLTVG